MASRLCPAILSSMPSSLPLMPPVSMAMKRRPCTLPSPYLRSRVSPGKSATRASRERVKRLNRVDLPTLGRPTRAITGIMGFLSADLQRRQIAVVAVYVECVVAGEHGCPHTAAVDADAPGESAVHLRDVMH